MKARHIVQLVFNVLTLIACCFGILVFCNAITFNESVAFQPIDLVQNFSAFLSLIVGFGALIGLIGNIYCLAKGKAEHPALFVVKLISATTGFVLFLTNLLYALPKGVQFSGHVIVIICLCYLVPLLLTASTIFLSLDNKWKFKYSFLSPIIIMAFLAFDIPLIINGTFTDIYEIAPYFTAATWWKGLTFVAIYVFGSFGIGVAIWVLNRICYLIFAGDEVDKEITVEEEEVAKTVVVTKEELKEEEKEEEEVTKAGYIGPRVYHISRHKQDGRWQVKFANGQRALKITDTQAEAIVYAKQLIKKYGGGSLRVHSVKGRIRKA